jgi:predicted dehydrogenase
MPYGVLLITGGRTHQENYAAAFAADKRARIIGLTDEPTVDRRRREFNEALAAKLKVPHLPDLDEALRRKDVDLVCVCTEPARRARVIVKCAQAGKHLYLDKSLCPSATDAEAIVAAVKQSGVKSHMFSFISAPWAQSARRAIAAGRLGEIVAVHADSFFAKGKTGTTDPARRRKEEHPAGRHQLVEAKREFDNIGVYGIVMSAFLAEKKFKTVYAATGNYFFREHARHDVEDFGLLAGRFEDGSPVTVAAGRFGWATHPAAGVNRVFVVGSKQSMMVDANRPRLEVYTDEAPWLPPSPHPEDPMAFWQSTTDESGAKPKRTWVPAGAPAGSDAGYFLDCLDAGRDSELSVVEAAAAAAVLDAAYLSAARAEPVTLAAGGA